MKTLLLGLLAVSAFAQGVGVDAHGIDLTQNAAATNGGYQRFAPVTYNPHDGLTCLDLWGNQVQQPMPTANLVSAFGANDLFLWNSLSPSMPMTSGSTTPAGLVQPVYYNDTTATGPCGLALPVNLNYGLNTNGYFFARGGLATDQAYFNSIQSLQGGVLAGSFTAGIYYNSGTVVCTAYNGSSCTATSTLSAGAYLGGHVDTGHSNGPPACVGTYPACVGIGSVSNPLTGNEGLVAGMIYYDDALGCERVYSGSAWSCMSGGLPASPANSVQFNNAGVLGGSSNFVWNNSTDVLTIAGGTTSGVVAPVFSSSATGSNSAFVAGGGAAIITGAGNVAAQSLALTNGLTVDSGAYGLSGTGAITALSATAGVHNSTSTGSTAAFQQYLGTFVITGAGNATFQSVGVTNGVTAATLTASSPGSSLYSLTVGHGVTISAGGLSNTGGISTDTLATTGNLTVGSGGTLYALGSASISNVLSVVSGIIDTGYLTITGAIVVAGNTGVSGSTCTAWTNGVCTHL